MCVCVCCYHTPSAAFIFSLIGKNLTDQLRNLRNVCTHAGDPETTRALLLLPPRVWKRKRTHTFTSLCVWTERSKAAASSSLTVSTSCVGSEVCVFRCRALAGACVSQHAVCVKRETSTSLEAIPRRRQRWRDVCGSSGSLSHRKIGMVIINNYNRLRKECMKVKL